MTTLDEIRAEIVARRDEAQSDIDDAVAARERANIELEAHDRAVALFAPPPEPKRAERRDIASLVLDALTDEWQTVAEIAKATGCAPSRVLPALMRLGVTKAVNNMVGEYKRGTGELL